MAFKGLRDFNTADPARLRSDLQRFNEALEQGFSAAATAGAERWVPRVTNVDTRVRHSMAVFVDATNPVRLYLPESGKETRGRGVRVVRAFGSAAIKVIATSRQYVQGNPTDTLGPDTIHREYLDDGLGRWWRQEEGLPQGRVLALTGAANTLAYIHRYAYVTVTHSSTTTVTVPPSSEVDYAIATETQLVQAGAGQLVVAAGSGVTIRTPETLKARKQYSIVVLKKVATDEWHFTGDLELA